jgi:hypothetical protein
MTSTKMNNSKIGNSIYNNNGLPIGNIIDIIQNGYKLTTGKTINNSDEGIIWIPKTIQEDQEYLYNSISLLESQKINKKNKFIWLLEGKSICDYDFYSNFVICARTEEEARLIADGNAGDEARLISPLINRYIIGQYWRLDNFSSCTKIGSLVINHHIGIICSSHHNV